MAVINIDVTDVTASTAPLSREPLPPGDYAVMITASEQRQTKALTGHYLQLEMQVLDGPHAGRRLWDRLNLWNTNEKAVEIARRTLREITDAIGHPPQVADSEALHGRPLVAHVEVRQDSGFGVGNEVKGYRASVAARAPAAPRAPAAAPAPAAPAGRPSWMK